MNLPTWALLLHQNQFTVASALKAAKSNFEEAIRKEIPRLHWLIAGLPIHIFIWRIKASGAGSGLSVRKTGTEQSARVDDSIGDNL